MGKKLHNRRFEHLAQGDEGASLPSYPITPTGAGRGGGSVFESSGSKVVSFNRRERDDVEVPKFVIAGESKPSPEVRERRRQDDWGVRHSTEGEGDDVAGDVLPEMRLDARDEEDAAARGASHR
jgi:hypothetical protein